MHQQQQAAPGNAQQKTQQEQPKEAVTIGDAKDWTVNENSRDRNLALRLYRDITVTTDANNDYIMLRIKDNTGHITTTEKRFSIDKKAPVIEVTGIEKKQEVVYYNTTKNVNVTVYERNYDTPRVNGGTDT